MVNGRPAAQKSVDNVNQSTIYEVGNSDMVTEAAWLFSFGGIAWFLIYTIDRVLFSIVQLFHKYVMFGAYTGRRILINV
jgi:hypothetical protein